MKSSSDKVYTIVARSGRREYYYCLNGNKSKKFPHKRDCAMEFVTKFIESSPSHKELVYDKTWDEIFRIFGIQV